MKVEKFDQVHDVQKIYREVLDSMSKPGTINNIHEILSKVEVYSDIPRELMGMAYLLLNAESSFYIDGREKARYIKLHTYGKPVPRNLADFILLDEASEGEDGVVQAVKEAKRGELQDPHLGATFIVKVESLDEGKGFKISGPGIKGNDEVKLGGLGQAFIEARREANCEYPMGVDFILIDNKGRVVALPRTTEIGVV